MSCGNLIGWTGPLTAPSESQNDCANATVAVASRAATTARASARVMVGPARNLTRWFRGCQRLCESRHKVEALDRARKAPAAESKPGDPAGIRRRGGDSA